MVELQIVINPFTSIQSSVMVEASLDNGIEGIVLVFDQPIEASGFFDRPVMPFVQ